MYVIALAVDVHKVTGLIVFGKRGEYFTTTGITKIRSHINCTIIKSDQFTFAMWITLEYGRCSLA